MRKQRRKQDSVVQKDDHAKFKITERERQRGGMGLPLSRGVPMPYWKFIGKNKEGKQGSWQKFGTVALCRLP